MDGISNSLIGHIENKGDDKNDFLRVHKQRKTKRQTNIPDVAVGYPIGDVYIAFADV